MLLPLGWRGLGARAVEMAAAARHALTTWSLRPTRASFQVQGVAQRREWELP